MARIRYRLPPRKVLASAALMALLGGAGVATLTLDTVEEFEGYVPEGYLDPVGIPTKCWGDTRQVVIGKPYSFEECSRSLNEHLTELVLPLTSCIRDFASLPDKTKAALASMTYNIGSRAMCQSSIVKKLNAGDSEGACRRMAEIYKTAKGRELPGLVKRRRYESAMCLAGLREAAHPLQEKARETQ